MHTLKALLPLIFIVGCIIVADVLWQYTMGTFSVMNSMRIFMGLFFLVFGFFKILDWKGFAHAFAEYDIVAKRSTVYAHLYPAMEIVLGVLYLAALASIVVNAGAAVIMFVGSIGVARALFGNQELHCACLGTVVKLPMTYITLIEDCGMGVMALAMLAILI